MKNNTWVCFTCRTSYRRPDTTQITVKCACCREYCVNLGFQTPVPKKRDVKSWNKLHEALFARAQLAHKHAKIERVRIAHDIEQGQWRLDVLTKYKRSVKAFKKVHKRAKKCAIREG